ncbi:MAG TPA: hypothetical protein VMD52_00630 [Patescibacteria group bacterium]|nr:hypothetical protein [Patescibacteria group bacterium]
MMKKHMVCVGVLFLFGMAGCSSLGEGMRGFLGVSTKALEQERGSALSRNFEYDYFTAYSRTLDALKQIKAYIYAKGISKHMIAIYVSQDDTTPVGIFFTEKEKNLTRVEVSSPSTYAKETIAQKLFSLLEGPAKKVDVKQE